MSDELATVFARVTERLPPVQWPTPDEIRAGARVRRRRRTALVLVSVLVAVVAMGIPATLGSWKARFPAVGPAGTPPCPSGLIPVRLEMPDEPGIVLRIFDGTGNTWSAEAAATELGRRGFAVAAEERFDGTFDGVALIRYGPKAVGAAWFVQAYFLNEAELEFQLLREDDMVDVVLGPDFGNVATVTEVNQAVAANGNPPLPEGTCQVG